MLNGEVTDRISDLTESLNRTTEILSTADRMMDHYRNLNREQEFEIARVIYFIYSGYVNLISKKSRFLYVK